MKKTGLTIAIALMSLSMSFAAAADGTGGRAVKLISYDNQQAGSAVQTNGGESSADTSSAVTLPLLNEKMPVVTDVPSNIRESSGLEIDKVNVPADTSVLITLSGDRSSDSGTLNVYRKEDTAAGRTYKLQLSVPAKLGKNGLYKTKEGDSKTPVGIFKMNTPFGRADKLEGFPDNYLKVDANYYWDGDSESSLYNKMVNASVYKAFDKSKSEHIVDYGAYYNYCIDTGYNADCTPYKGSAIYLHCVVNNENTHGCIAIPEADMIRIMKMYDEGHTYIAIYDNADVQAMYK